MDERRKDLAEHICQLGGETRGDIYAVADAILADPQGHVDALVDAGVLDQPIHSAHLWQSRCYVVVQPAPPRACKHCGERIERFVFRRDDTSRAEDWRHVHGERQCRTMAEPA